MARQGLIVLILGLLVFAPEVRANLIWDRASPATERGAIVAALSDPDDPQVAWVASETRVWVSDDGGLAWYLVAQIMGLDQRDRAAVDLEEQEEEDKEEGEEEEEEEESSDELFGEGSASPIADPEGAETGFSRGRGQRGQGSRTPPIVRLRMVGDQVFLTGDRGLWAIDRHARTLGSAVEVRLGRAVAVRDLVEAPWGAVLVATSEGLREINDSGLSRPIRGALGERDTLALCRSGSLVIAASAAEGLWLVDQSGSRRVGLAGLQGPRDLVALEDGSVLVATSREVLRVAAKEGRALQRWPLTSIERVAAERSGRLWAVGPEGAWSFTPEGAEAPDSGQWTLQSEGMGDRRLRDVAVPSERGDEKTGDVYLWAVGRGGVWRRVPERVWLSTRRERAGDLRIEEGAPPVWELLDGAHQAHQVTRERIGQMRTRGHWAALLPSLEVEYQYRIRREEDLLTLTDLETNFITQVQVYPNGHHVKVMALWDLYPVIWGFFETDNPFSGPTIAQETTRSLSERAQIRRALVGLYTLWTQQREAWRRTQAPSAQAALKSIISLQHIEADLHVLSHRRFTPMTTLETIQQGGTP